MTNRVTLAAIIGAHGVRGEVRLKSFTDEPAKLTGFDPVYVGQQPTRVLSVGGAGKSVTARLQGVNDRTAAEALRGQVLEVEREALPPLDKDEYYHADLIGLAAADISGQAVGSVVAVENYGAGDLLEIQGEGGRRSLIPFKPGIADLVNGRIVLDPAFLA